MVIYFWPFLPSKGPKRAKFGKWAIHFGSLDDFLKIWSDVFFCQNTTFSRISSCKKVIFLRKSRFRYTCTCISSLQIDPKNLKKFGDAQGCWGNPLTDFERFFLFRLTRTVPYIYIIKTNSWSHEAQKSNIKPQFKQKQHIKSKKF